MNVIPQIDIRRFYELLVMLLVCAAILPTNVVAQITTQSLDSYSQPQRNLRFASFSADQGLSQDSVTALVQDQQGFVWIGTQEGLNRFDGQTIEVFERDPFNVSSLAHNWIWTLMLANNGELWVGTENGISVHDSDTNSFTNLRHNPNDKNSLSSDRIRALHQDSLNNIWVGTVNAGVNRIDAATGNVQRYYFDEDDVSSIPDDAVLTISEDRQGQIWIGFDGGGIALYDAKNDVFVRDPHQSEDQNLSFESITTVFEDTSQDGLLWIGSRDGGLFRLNTQTNSLERFVHKPNDHNSISNNYVRDIVQDRDGTLWVATDEGLNEWQPGSQQFTRYYSDPADPTSLNENRISQLFESADGVLWIGTYAGVNTWNFLSDAFVQYQARNGVLGNDSVTSIAESASLELWVGTYGGGVTQINDSSGRVTVYKKGSFKNRAETLSDNRITALFIDAEDIVWAGTRRHGLNKLNPQTGIVEHIKKPQLSSNRISSIHGDPDGTVWVGTFGRGLNRINPDGSIDQFMHDPDDVTTLSGTRVLTIMRTKNGDLWVGTEDGGINRWIESTQRFERYRHSVNEPNSLSSDAGWEIYETSDGSLWIATMTDGLNQWLPEDRAANRAVFKKWSKTNGLRSNTAFGLLEDDSGNLWVSTNRGISRIQLSDHSIRHYDRKNGLISDEYNHGARIKRGTGQLLFGGPDGLVAFHPEQIRRSSQVPPVVLQGHSPLELLAVRHSGTPNAAPITLHHTDNFVAFRFAALDYTSADKNDYRYQLEGFDSDWINPGDARRITYANLAPGDYLFRVKAANNDGVWNEQGAAMAITVLPAPWQTNFAYAMYALLVLLLFASGARYYRQRVENEAKQRIELERLVQQRTFELGNRNGQLEELNEKLLRASFTDSLTDLYNRRYLDQFIDNKLASIRREGFERNSQPDLDYFHSQQSVLFFMMIDLDGFKAINDTYGHTAGDKALLFVRDELLDCSRASDTVIRWGGDEFLIIGETQGLSGIANFAERIRLAISERNYVVVEDQIARLSCSIGAVPYPFTPTQADLLGWEQSLNLADIAAYLAKSNGRDGWVVLSGNNSLSSNDIETLPRSIEPLLDEGKLQVSTSIDEPIKFTINRSVA